MGFRGLVGRSPSGALVQAKGRARAFRRYHLRRDFSSPGWELRGGGGGLRLCVSKRKRRNRGRERGVGANFVSVGGIIRRPAAGGAQKLRLKWSC